MNSYERWLTFLLRLGGVLTGMAAFAVFLPVESMASIHRDLGLGEFPVAPISDYLTRSLSGMYALHGVVLLALSADVRRYRPAITWLAWGTVIFGVVLTGIDLLAPMPVWWTLMEGPWVVVAGLALVWLCGKLRRAAAAG